MATWLYFNQQVSVPPVFDTTPCMQHMLEYEGCVKDTNIKKSNFYMPTWPTLYPLFLHYKTDIPAPFSKHETDADKYKTNDYFYHPKLINHVPSNVLYTNKFHLTDKKLQMLYECEEERHVFKACLREVLSLKRTDKHTSWYTADISALYLT